MSRALSAFVLGLGASALAVPACAGASLSAAWFVRAKDATASAMLADRTECVSQAEQFGVDRASDFSNPEYGSLTALGAALDEDALHGGAKQAVRRAVRDACMSKRGWTRVDASEADAKLLKKANAHHPDDLDAWIKANADKAPPPPAPKAPVAVAKTEAATAPVVDAGKLQEVAMPTAAAAEPAPTPAAASGTSAAVASPTVDAGKLQEVAKPAGTAAPRA
jgi:hypothetical protein